MVEISKIRRDDNMLFGSRSNFLSAKNLMFVFWSPYSVTNTCSESVVICFAICGKSIFLDYKVKINILSHKIVGKYIKRLYFCGTNFEANHNKDYSVVKTFKAGLTSRFLYCFKF